MEINEKKLYFLRGLGIGIIITTIVCCFFPEKQNDSEIISRAKELGMVEASDTQEKRIESVISGTQDDKQASEQNAISDENIPMNNSVDENVPEVTQEPTQEPTIEPVATEEPVVTEPPVDDTPKSVVIEITSGMSSESVAKKLYQNGLVDNASAFNKYMVSNGYASRLNVGKFEIPVGADYETIAKALDK